MLDEAAAANPGMKSAVLDIEQRDCDSAFCGADEDRLSGPERRHPQRGHHADESVQKGETADAEAMVTTNLLGPIRLTAALLPQLLAQPQRGDPDRLVRAWRSCRWR